MTIRFRKTIKLKPYKKDTFIYFVEPNIGGLYGPSIGAGCGALGSISYEPESVWMISRQVMPWKIMVPMDVYQRLQKNNNPLASIPAWNLLDSNINTDKDWEQANDDLRTSRWCYKRSLGRILMPNAHAKLLAFTNMNTIQKVLSMKNSTELTEDLLPKFEYDTKLMHMNEVNKAYKLLLKSHI